MSEPLKITELKMTCSACPSQWEGRLSDGSLLYARFRHGYFYVTIDGDKIFGTDIEGGSDGVMGTDKMLRLVKRFTGLELEVPKDE